MSDEAVAGLQQDGYRVTDYGQMQLAQYPFICTILKQFSLRHSQSRVNTL